MVQVKTCERDGYTAVQVTYGRKPARKLTKPEAGHFAKAKVEPSTRLVELRLDDVDGFSVATRSGPTWSAQATRSTSRRSAGARAGPAMKRYNFNGQGASHGNHKIHRSPGSIGACSFPAGSSRARRWRAFRWPRGVTTLNLEVVEADAERDLVLVKGAIPGPQGVASSSSATP